MIGFSASRTWIFWKIWGKSIDFVVACNKLRRYTESFPRVFTTKTQRTRRLPGNVSEILVSVLFVSLW
jgi:hypothetical protein